MLCSFACSQQATRNSTPRPSPEDLAPSPKLYKQGLIQQATAGLIFEDDRVEIEHGRVSSVDDVATARAAMRLGADHLERGRRLEALAAYTRAVLAAPRTPAPYLGLARALGAKGRSREARAAVKKAIGLAPNGSEAYELLGSLEERLGHREAAILAYQKALVVAPGQGRPHARLAVLHALRGERRSAQRHLAAARDAGAAVPARISDLLAGRTAPFARVESIAGGSSIVVGPEVRIDAGGGAAQANEISASVAAASTPEVVAAWNDFRTEVRLGVGLSLDGGATWTDQLIRPPLPNQSMLEGDPMSAYDPRTGTLWVGGLSFLSNGGIFVARKPAGATEFEASVMVWESSGVDKPWMTAGRPPATPEATHLYVAYNFGLQTSGDLGATWGPIVPLEPGFGYLPRIAPNGELHIANSNFETVRLQTSLDGGTTVGPPVTAATRIEPYDPFETIQIPGTFRAPAFNILAIDPRSGRLTFVWFDTASISGDETDVDLYFCHSEDGLTWTQPTALPLPGDQFLPWLEIDTTGRMHLVFLDTRNTAQSDSDTVAWIDAYYAFSEDGGDSWSEIQLTETPWSSALAGPFDLGFGEQFIGDYLGLTVTEDQAFPVYLSTQNGDADLFTRVISFGRDVVFSDGFESGDTSRWQ
ncbi:MAG: hypothetical protein AAF560_12380 [Acidobacteriota bacterium]